MTEFISISCVTSYTLPVKTGTKGELLAKMFLMKHGYVILSVNLAIYQGKQVGEIDILALKNSCLYIVEVKTIDRQYSTGWIRSDILTYKKYSKLRLIRSMILALKSGFSGKGRGLIDSLTNTSVEDSFLRSSGRNMLRDILVPKVIHQIKLVKIVLAEVVLSSDTGYDIQFIHINSGYY